MGKKQQQIEAPNWADWAVLLMSYLAAGPSALAVLLGDAAILFNGQSQRIDARKKFSREAHMALEQITGDR